VTAHTFVTALTLATALHAAATKLQATTHLPPHLAAAFVFASGLTSRFGLLLSGRIARACTRTLAVSSAILPPPSWFAASCNVGSGGRSGFSGATSSAARNRASRRSGAWFRHSNLVQLTCQADKTCGLYRACYGSTPHSTRVQPFACHLRTCASFLTTTAIRALALTATPLLSLTAAQAGCGSLRHSTRIHARITTRHKIGAAGLPPRHIYGPRRALHLIHTAPPPSAFLAYLHHRLTTAVASPNYRDGYRRLPGAAVTSCGWADERRVDMGGQCLCGRRQADRTATVSFANSRLAPSCGDSISIFCQHAHLAQTHHLAQRFDAFRCAPDAGITADMAHYHRRGALSFIDIPAKSFVTTVQNHAWRGCMVAPEQNILQRRSFLCWKNTSGHYCLPVPRRRYRGIPPAAILCISAASGMLRVCLQTRRFCTVHTAHCTYAPFGISYRIPLKALLARLATTFCQAFAGTHLVPLDCDRHTLRTAHCPHRARASFPAAHS